MWPVEEAWPGPLIPGVDGRLTRPVLSLLMPEHVAHLGCVQFNFLLFCALLFRCSWYQVSRGKWSKNQAEVKVLSGLGGGGVYAQPH